MVSRWSVAQDMAATGLENSVNDREVQPVKIGVVISQTPKLRLETEASHLRDQKDDGLGHQHDQWSGEDFAEHGAKRPVFAIELGPVAVITSRLS